MKQLTIVLIGLFIMNACTKEEDVAVISTRFGEMVVTFYPDVAPKHVESFKIHAENGYFEGTAFHRVMPGFMIQGGDPNSKDGDKSNDGQGGYAAKFYGLGDEEMDTSWMIPAEFNDRPHVTGALSMARTSDPNSAGSQFFICDAPVPRLNNQYTVFGQVISGLEVIEKIANTPRDRRDNPNEKVAMNISIMPRSKALGE